MALIIHNIIRTALAGCCRCYAAYIAHRYKVSRECYMASVCVHVGTFIYLGSKEGVQRVFRVHLKLWTGAGESRFSLILIICI